MSGQAQGSWHALTQNFMCMVSEDVNIQSPKTHHTYLHSDRLAGCMALAASGKTIIRLVSFYALITTMKCQASMAWIIWQNHILLQALSLPGECVGIMEGDGATLPW